jgi:hypothetical protein
MNLYLYFKLRLLCLWVRIVCSLATWHDDGRFDQDIVAESKVAAAQE